MPVTAQGLEPKQVKLVQDSIRFFVALSDSRVARRAVERAHYSKAQHDRGIALRRRASGDEVPLPADLKTLVPTTASPWDVVLGRLDDFENTWVPLTKTAAAMSCKGDAYLVVAALFDEFKQAARGPEVVRTVTGWVRGWDALEARKAEIAGAAEMQATLLDTGLTVDKVAAVRADLAAVEAGGDMTAVPGVEAAHEAAVADQKAAFVELRAWLNHWALRFRQTMPYADLVKMGLRKVKRKAAEATAPAEPGDDVFEDDEEPSAPA